ncbi:MAG: DUF4783 domain-containing protein [Sphingobacteriaceae bacterium]|nr:DUF4783 domain-containing protein [Sphingobacteriaceae bacterium]
MKTSLYILYLFFTILLSPTDISEEIVAAIKSGKSSELVKYFDEKISIKIINQEDVLSKSQAEANLNYFFSKHSVKSYTSSQSGNSVNSSAQYITGILDTSNGKFKISILIKRNLITQLRIEPYNE